MRFLIAYILFFFTLTLIGQQTNTQHNIVGFVYDADTDQPLPYATITLQNLENKNFSGGVTNNKGFFDLDISQGKYIITVQFLSFEPFIINSLNINQDIDLGMIELSQKFENLDEVELNSGKSIVDYRFNKKIYYASKDISNLGGNAITVLENTPSVRIDDNGNISVRGNKATVLVNEKLFGGQDGNSNVLSLIPSNSISKIEIISPSAKYDAEGGGGIINIVLKKGKGEGYTGTLEIHGGLPDNDGISSFINYKSDKINVYSTASFNHTVKIKKTQLDQKYFNAFDIPSGSLDEKRVDDRQKNSFLFNIGSDFTINKKNTLTTSVLYSLANKNYDSNLFLKDFNATDNLTQTNDRDVSDDTDEYYFEALLNYTTLFDLEKHKLSFDLKYNSSYSDNITDIINNITIPTSDQSQQQSTKLQNLSNYLFQIDYQIPITENGLLETGFKTNVRKYANSFQYSNLNPVTRIYEPISGYQNDIDYDENIYALYANFSKKINSFNYSLGLRTEVTDTKINELNSEEITNNYTKFFPSVNLSYTLKNESLLSFNYSRLIDRPSVAELNPFTSIADERFILTGNPHLNPYDTNYFILEYYHEFSKFNFSTALFYSSTTDQIRYIIENTGDQTDDNFDIYIRNPINDGNLDQYGLDFNFTYTPTNQLRFRWYVSPYYFNISNTLENAYDHDDFVVYSNFVGDYRFSNGLKIQLNYTFQSPKKTALTKIETIQFLNASISKDLFKKKATLTFRASDILNTRTYDFESFEANTFTHKNWRFDSQYLLSFTYRFNKASRKNSHNRSKDTDKEIFEIDEDIK
ncbi:MAG: TonB-dependent receptor [Bacteroidota bacterium]